MIRSAQTFLPRGWNIVVYDLLGNWGLTNRQAAQRWCNVTIYPFVPPLGFAAHSRRDLQSCAWKPLIIQQELSKLAAGSALIWADASQRFKQNLESLVRRAFEVGHLTRHTAGPIALYTHPQTIKVLAEPAVAGNIVAHDNIQDYVNATMIAAGIGIYPKNPLTDQIVNAWVRCMMLPRCVTPTTSSGWDGTQKCRPDLKGHCHRVDQSALNVILFEALGRNGTGLYGLPYNAAALGHAIATVRSAQDKTINNAPLRC